MTAAPGGLQDGTSPDGERVAVALAAATFFIALLIHALRPGVTDVSWLLVVGERVLGGDRLYVDLLEVNPPASLLLYLPAVWLGRVTGAAAEWFVLAMVALTFLASTWSVGRILRGAGLLHRPGSAALAAVVAFMLLPGDSFAQREHFGVLLVAPALALIVRRMSGAPELAAPQAFVIGVAAGCAVCVKPQFALALLLPQFYAAWRARSLRPMLHVDNWVILGVVTLYAAATAAWFPAFWTEMLPLVTQAYRQQRLPAGLLLFALAPVVVPTLLHLALRPRLLARAIVPLLAALGFVIAFLEQGKGWPYHLLPATSLLAFVVARDALHALTEETTPASRVLPLVVAAVLAALSGVIYHDTNDATRDIEAAVRATSPRPRLLTLTGDIALGHPLTRRVGGEWVGATPSQWITSNARKLVKQEPAAAERLAPLVALDRALFRRGLARAPDALLVDRRGDPSFWMAWAREDPEVARLLEDYVLRQSGEHVDLYVRR